MQNSSILRSHYDVIVVGARCAGSSTAMLLARADARVLLIDKHEFGRDVISTHAIMRTGVLQLARWGLLPEIEAAGTPPITKTTFHYGGDVCPIDIKSEHGVDYLCAPRRTVLDKVLVNAARKAGAEVHHAMSLQKLKTALDGRVVGVNVKDRYGVKSEITADLVVGADGRQSLVANLVKAQTYARGQSRSGCVYGYFSNIQSDGFHWYFNNNAAGGVIPTNENQHCVFAAVPADHFADTYREDMAGGFRKIARANSPELHQMLEDAQLVGRLHGFVGFAGHMKQSYGPGWCLVGDSGYFKDPLTAHGITDALRDGELLSEAILRGEARAFVRYQENRDALSKDLFEVTDKIASFDWDNNKIKSLHSQLSASMKIETEFVAGLTAKTSLAA